MNAHGDIAIRLSETIRQTKPAGNEPETATLLNNLGVVSQALGRFTEAQSHYQEAHAILESFCGSNDLRVAQNYSNRASACREMQIYPEAERLFQLAAKIWDHSGWPKQMPTLAKAESQDAFVETALWSEEVASGDVLSNYGREIANLRSAVERGERTADLKAMIERLGPWYHNVQLTKTTGTNPGNPDYPLSRWRGMEQWIPRNLKGKSVLDIGCNSGFFSLEMKRRGAERVVGIDIMPHILAQARFTSHWFGLPLELREFSAYDVEQLGTFDYVIFIGVLYHLKHPLYALEKVASVCKDTLYFQSMIRGAMADFNPKDDYPSSEFEVFKEPTFPKLYFIEKSYNSDESNWWFATRSCLKAMLRVSGFREVLDTPIDELFVCRK